MLTQKVINIVGDQKQLTSFWLNNILSTKNMTAGHHVCGNAYQITRKLK